VQGSSVVCNLEKLLTKTVLIVRVPSSVVAEEYRGRNFGSLIRMLVRVYHHSTSSGCIMNSGPRLRYRLPHRTAGSFGHSAIGRAGEWLTASWPRFGTFLSWLTIVLFAFSSSQSDYELLLVLASSPLLAIFVYVGCVLAGWISYFIPVTGTLFGIIRLFYLWLFSRLIVEEAPEVEFDLWRHHR
jgi:hypothetical protein